MGIMSEFDAVLSLDVREMLCAQALALVAQAATRLKLGDALEIWYNTPDVKHDLLAWATDQGYSVQAQGHSSLRLTRPV